MPIISSSYRTTGLFRNGHFSTIYSAKLRIAPGLQQERKRISLPDQDFLDLDFSLTKKDNRKIAILLHGMEGNAQRSYIRGQGTQLLLNDWDVCAMNYRGCSGEDNKFYYSYNAGRTNDLHSVILHLLENYGYDQIAIIGFSLGGNLLLKYLGEGNAVPKEVKKAIAVSSPLSLKGSLERLIERQNWVYSTTFLKYLRKKYRMKMPSHPEKMSREELRKIKSLLDFDQIYTAPAHGYKDAWDYYEKNSCLQFLPEIEVPALILNARNDTFLSPLCYPVDIAENSKAIYLESPAHGGHVGFYRPGNVYYNEERAIDFLKA